jgi:two-component system, NtrC family, nitrogen regulation sensor histidine kinase GlnL
MRISREEALMTRQETIKVLTRGLAHEVKNPLGGIRGAAQLLERDLDDPDLKEFTRIIVEEVDRLRDLVDSMLGPNRLTRHDPLNVHKVLERVRSLLIAEHPEVWIERDYDPSLPDLAGDEAQMIQAVLNVARNAVEAMTEAGTDRAAPAAAHPGAAPVHPGRRAPPPGLRGGIIDNGPGIPEACRRPSSTPWSPAAPTAVDWACPSPRRILHQHQGLIECESARAIPNSDCLFPGEAP